jgi:hypothetical protein
VKLDAATEAALGARSAARRTIGTKWTFRKGPFFSREQRR